MITETGTLLSIMDMMESIEHLQEKRPALAPGARQRSNCKTGVLLAFYEQMGVKQGLRKDWKRTHAVVPAAGTARAYLWGCGSCTSLAKTISQSFLTT